MPSLNDYDLLADPIRGMFKGEHGTGKSILASSFPKPHFFFFEKRWKSLYSYWLRVDPAKLKDITYDDMTGLTKYAIDQKIKEIISRPAPKTLVFDSITSGGDSLLYRLSKDKAGQTRAAGQEAGKKIGGIEVNELEDFNAEDAQFKDWREQFMGYSGHIIWIAHVVTIERTNAAGQALAPSRQIVTGAKKLAAKLPIYFDEIWHTQVNSGKYEFLTKHGGTDYAKTSLPLDEKIDFTDGNGYDLVIDNVRKNYDSLVKMRQQREELAARIKRI